MTKDNQQPTKQQGKPTSAVNTPNQNQKTKGPSKVPLIVLGVSTVFLILVLAFALFQNSSLKKQRNQAIEAYNQTQVIPNNCQDGNQSICLYAKTTAVDDYLMIVTNTLQVKPSTSYDIMLEVVPSKLAPKDAAVNTDCRPNNHHLYICQRMTTASPKKLLESLLGSYDNLNPNIEYNVSLILTPRATLIADDSQPNNMQMAPTAAGGQPQPQVDQSQVNEQQATQQATPEQQISDQPASAAETQPLPEQQGNSAEQ